MSGFKLPLVEPTDDELKTISTVGEAADWAFLPNRESGEDALDSPRGTFLKTLGAKEAHPVRIIGNIPAEEYNELVVNWTIRGIMPSPVLRSSAGLLGTACRIAAGSQKRKEVVRAEHNLFIENRLKERTIEAQLASAAAQTTAVNTSATIGPKRIKLATIVDQANDGEAGELTAEEVARAYDNYRKSQGGDPRPEEDLTKDQLAGLKCLFASGSAPYVDLAVWGPYGLRMQKKLRMSGLIMGAGGQLVQTQLYGPPNVEEWLAGWTVFKTGAIMLDKVTPSTCDHWSKMVLGYAKTYGPSCWALVYQAEVRARLEHLERVRRVGAAEAAQAKESNISHSFDESRPWDWALRKCADDVLFWRRELEDAAMLVKVHISKLSDTIGNDANIASIVDSTVPVTNNRQQHPPPPHHGHERPVKKQRMAAGDKVHNSDGDGNLTSNRRGTPLCSGFQDGSCPYNKANIRCPKNKDCVHQCARCLSASHGRAWPRACTNDPAGPPPKGKGAKGSGKKGGKKAMY